MPSWQSRLVTRILQRTSKRGPLNARLRRTRAATRRLEPFLGRARKDLRVTAAQGAPVPCEWVEPVAYDGMSSGPKTTLLYLHGGAYLFCSPRTHRGITAFLANAIPARVLVPDYRLAPEHPFPAALEDALACLRWLARDPEANKVVLAGDSAGGGLALAAMLALRDAHEALPAGAALIAPWTDLAATGASILSNSVTDAWVEGEAVALGAKLYLGETPAVHPLASPLYADLDGLPPLLIHVSNNEVLLDDSLRLAAKARASGVSVTLKIWEGLPHVWQGFVPFIPEARQSLEEIAAFLEHRHFPGAAPTATPRESRP